MAENRPISNRVLMAIYLVGVILVSLTLLKAIMWVDGVK